MRRRILGMAGLARLGPAPSVVARYGPFCSGVAGPVRNRSVRYYSARLFSAGMALCSKALCSVLPLVKALRGRRLQYSGVLDENS